jgi:hypothetical protein
MTTGDVDALKALLDQTEAAHGQFEKTTLNGVYDQEWAGWYATYAVEHGIGDLLGRSVSDEELERFLASSYVDFQQAEPKPSEPWSAYTARRIAGEM